MTDPADALKWNRKRRRARKEERAARREQRDGSQGAASAVRILDRVTLKPIEIILPSSSKAAVASR